MSYRNRSFLCWISVLLWSRSSTLWPHPFVFEWYCIFYAIVCWKYIICLLTYGITFKKLLWVSEESLKHGLLNSIKKCGRLWNLMTVDYIHFFFLIYPCTMYCLNQGIQHDSFFLNEDGSYKLKYSVDCLERIRRGDPVWGGMSLGWFWNLKWVLSSSVSASCLQIKMWSLSCHSSHASAMSSWTLAFWNIERVKAFPL